MYVVLTPEDWGELKPGILQEIVAYLQRRAESASGNAATVPEGGAGMDFTGVVDLTPEQVKNLVKGVNNETKDCLRVFAEHGPVIDAKLLGITNYSHLQMRLTKRTRTITGNKNAYLITWDEWKFENGNLITGHYAVTVVTHKSLRKYFGLK